MKKTAWWLLTVCALVAVAMTALPSMADISEAQQRFNPDALRSSEHGILRDFDRSSSIHVDNLSFYLGAVEKGGESETGWTLEVLVDLIPHSFEIVDADKEWVEKIFDKFSEEEKSHYLTRIARYIERKLSLRFKDVSSIINVRFRDWRMDASGKRMKGEFATYSNGALRISKGH